jgi:hypothetical protein
MPNKPILCRLFCVCLLLVLPDFSYADNEQLLTTEMPCPNLTQGGYETKYSTVSIVSEPHKSSYRWICYKGKILVQTKKASNGGFYDWSIDNLLYEDLKEGKELVKINGRTVLARMVIQEQTYGEDNQYWFLDFSKEEPLVIGPIIEHSATRNFSVIWEDQRVIIILDDNQPKFGTAHNWRGGPYKFREDLYVLGDNEEHIPILAINGKASTKDVEMFTAYVYDYKEKKLIQAVIEENLKR